MTKRIIWLTVSCLMILALVLTSCKPAPPKEKAPPKEEKPAGPQYGGHLTYAYNLEPDSLDPVMGRSGGDAYYWRRMFDQLIWCDANLEPQERFSLAKSWEFPDPKTILFHLREGVKFHDGTDFNAQAVKAQIERILDPDVGATPRGSFKVIKKVEVVDDYTAKFHLKTPWGACYGMLSDRGGAINSPTAVKERGKGYGFDVEGTGPFKLDEFVSGSHCHWVKNEEYWATDEEGNPLPYLDELTCRIIPEEAVVSAALEAGDIDLCFVPAKDVEKFKANPDIAITEFEGGSIALQAYFNREMPPMDNVYLRKAVSYAINPEAINEAVYYGKAIVADSGYWPTGCWAYEATKDVPRPYYDPEKAREFLKKGGKPEGFKVEGCTYSVPTKREAIEMIKAQLAEVGIDMEIHTYDVGTVTEKFFHTNDHPLYFTGWSRYPEPDWVASMCYRSEGYYNPSNKVVPEMDRLAKEGAATYDIEKRKEIYRQMWEIASGECWHTPLLYGVSYAGYWKDRVGGMDKFFGWDAKMRFKRIWLKQ